MKKGVAVVVVVVGLVFRAGGTNHCDTSAPLLSVQLVLISNFSIKLYIDTT
jgi:hypothetical protein